MAVLFTNNAQGVLSAGISAAATSVILNAGQGALFPVLAGADYFNATLFNAGGTKEIVKCTARAADTLTIVRGQEGTTASAFLAADKLDLRITAAGLANKLDKDTGGTVSGTLIVNANASVGLNAGSTFTINGTTLAIPNGFSTTAGVANFFQLQVNGVNVVDLSTGQTLTNKTLTTPIIASITTSGFTLTLPTLTANDTSVSRQSTDTLTNKTITGLNSASTVGDGAGGSFQIGYRGIPKDTQSGAYTLLPPAAGKYIYSQNVGAQAMTLATNAVQAIAIDAAIAIVNDGTSTITLTPAAGVTLVLAGLGTTGARTIAVNGMATLLHVGTDRWFISGPGVA